MAKFTPSKKKIHPDTKFVIGIGGTVFGVLWIQTNASTPKAAAQLAINHSDENAFILSIFEIHKSFMEEIDIPA